MCVCVCVCVCVCMYVYMCVHMCVYAVETRKRLRRMTGAHKIVENIKWRS